MKTRIRPLIGGFLFLAALVLFTEALTVTNSGSFFDLSGLARLIFCGLSVVCIIAATLIWKAKDARGRRQKGIIMALAIAAVIGGGFLDAYLEQNTATHEYTGDMFRIREAVAARFETADGRSVMVDSEIALLASLAELELQEAPMTPGDDPEDWIYRITYDPADQVSGGEEVVVYVHEKYLQIGTEYYLPIGGASFAGILEWFDGKAAYFLG
ncbi:MAG: hypothetical protein IKJ84_04150 [Oscillospiraceae bacterium]|nr:hypothetical protein [Oscillospiraceae bacterium]